MLFECLFSAQMPALEYLHVSCMTTPWSPHAEMANWSDPPTSHGNTSFPALRRFHVEGHLALSHDVLQFLKSLNKHHNWKISLENCEAPTLPLPDDVQALLEAANVTEEDFYAVLKQMEMDVECRYWGILSERTKQLALFGERFRKMFPDQMIELFPASP